MARRILQTWVAMAIILVGALDNAAALPGSAYVDGNGKSWQGYKTSTQDGYDLVLEWAVYNVAANPWAGSVDFPPDDQYIYAYQLFSSTTSTKDIGSFSVLDIEGNPITQTLMHETQAVANGQGLMPDPNPSTTQGEWHWSPGVGAGQYSAYLIFSSHNAPTTSGCKVEMPSGPVHINLSGIAAPIPEPATLLLLTLGGLFLQRK